MAVGTGMLWSLGKLPGAHNPERATPILDLWYGNFMNGLFLESTFSRENGSSALSMCSLVV